MPTSYWVTIFATATAVIFCVALHYEGLRLLSDRLPMPQRNQRRQVVLLILCLLLLHIVEIWIFGGAYYLLLEYGAAGALIGDTQLGLLDCVYYSASVFTTLGFGDIVPVGPIRFVTGTEALCGLTFITWSASFTFLEMLKIWNYADT